MITHAYTSKSGALIGKNGIYSGCIIKLPRCGSITLGRDSREVDIAITANCSKISRVHCDVSYDYSNGYYIDENGIKTMIKKQTIRAHSGDILCIGDDNNCFELL